MKKYHLRIYVLEFKHEGVSAWASIYKSQIFNLIEERYVCETVCFFSLDSAQWVIINSIIISHCPCVHRWMCQCTTNTKHISKWIFFFSNDISGSRGEFCRLSVLLFAFKYIQIHYWILCAFLSQLTRTTNLDLHFDCQVNERARAHYSMHERSTTSISTS